ncbi:hypothetical protein Ciccas_006885 [Cichlidogyrus casuarinus]|uniref:Uncharacterized protein n=1 Tax=Cichlidogyrus casuarinus TaxID=1844966 RepID=A0ABD2Q4G6_9PLAT
MWFGGKESQNKSNIDEANKHLVALYEKIDNLERELKEKEQTIENQNAEFNHLAVFEEARKEEQKDLIDRLSKAESRVRSLEQACNVKDCEIQTLRQRHSLLNELGKYKTMLAKMTITLEQAEQYSNQHGLNTGLKNGYGVDKRDTDPLINRATDILNRPAITFEEN